MPDNSVIAILLTVSLILSFGGGVKVESFAVSAEADTNITVLDYYLSKSTSSIPEETMENTFVGAKLSYHYTFDRNPSQSGVYIDLFGSYKNYVKAGFGINLHLADGKIKPNFGAVAGLHIPIINKDTEKEILKAFSVNLYTRYDFINMTREPAFSLEIGASADAYNLITNALDQH